MYGLVPPLTSSALYFFLKEREEENIQKRDCPCFGPSLRNSWPRPLPHLAQDTLRAPGPSCLLESTSGLTVSVKAGHGEECSYFLVLWKISVPHLEHAYTPRSGWMNWRIDVYLCSRKTHLPRSGLCISPPRTTRKTTWLSSPQVLTYHKRKSIRSINLWRNPSKPRPII